MNILELLTVITILFGFGAYATIALLHWIHIRRQIKENSQTYRELERHQLK